MNEQDTTAVLPPNSEEPDAPLEGTSSGQPKQAAEFVLTSVASVPAAKAASEKKRSSRLSEDKRFKIFSGSANRPLSEEVCKFLGVPLGQTRLQRFSDGELHFQLLENVRGVDVFLIQPTCHPVDQNVMELLIMMDALKRASAGRITVVVPYYGYARQDRKDRPRVAITSKLVADLLTTAGANRALLVDLHAAQIQGFFNIPVDHLFASPVLVGYFSNLNLPNLTVVSPDAGGEWITLAVVVKTQGRRGEVAVEVHSDIPDRFRQKMRLWALAKDASDQDGSRREVVVEDLWPHKEWLVLKFQGIETISDAEALVGAELQVPSGERAELEPGWTYLSDLIGCVVLDGEREIGKIEDVQFGAGEAPLLVVGSGSKLPYEIPYAEAYLVKLDLEGRRVRMKLPEGLLEVNAPAGKVEKGRSR